MTFDGADNTLSLPDHNDHIHVGFQPLFGTTPSRPASSTPRSSPANGSSSSTASGKIDNPTVPIKPSKYSIKVPKRASKAHVGE